VLRHMLGIDRPEMGPWQPIETAPNDTTILVYRSTGEFQLIQAEDNDYTWQPFVADGLDRPTHWMPLPAPPRSSTNDAAVKP
jgi:hypothetical protein